MMNEKARKQTDYNGTKRTFPKASVKEKALINQGFKVVGDYGFEPQTPSV